MNDDLYTKQDVLKMWERPYSVQINIAYTKALEAILRTGGKIAVSFSGGKDSAVTLFITAAVWATTDYKNQPLTVIFANTGNEFYGMAAYVKEYCQYIELRFGIKIDLRTAKSRETTFHQVIWEKGYPIASKRVSRMIRGIRKELRAKGYEYDDVDGKSFDELRDMGIADACVLYLTGITSDRRPSSTWVVPKKWRPLIAAPFETSEECCEFIKKKPLKLIQQELNGLQPVTGEMACDSRARLESYLRTGCNLFNENGVGISKPLGAVTEQTLLRFIHDNQLPIFRVYGDLRWNDDGCFCFAGEQRTGCKLCMFGIQFKGTGTERFKRLNEHEPQTVAWAFRPRSEKGLSFGEVVGYLNEYCMGRAKIWTP